MSKSVYHFTLSREWESKEVAYRFCYVTKGTAVASASGFHIPRECRGIRGSPHRVSVILIRVQRSRFDTQTVLNVVTSYLTLHLPITKEFKYRFFNILAFTSSDWLASLMTSASCSCESTQYTLHSHIVTRRVLVRAQSSTKATPKHCSHYLRSCT